MTRLLVVGGSGFVGSALANAVARRPDLHVRWAVHVTPPHVRKAGDEVIGVDLADASTVHGLARGCDAVVHLGHLLAGDATALAAVNDIGAATLAAEADRRGARLVALSVAAVHGSGPWTGEEIHSLPEEPISEVSRTRLAGDHRVLAVGGVVIRPHLVIGPGDRWVVPRAADLVAQYGWGVCGTARHSVVTVDDLAHRLLGTATDLDDRAGGVRFAAGPDPVTLRPAIEAQLHPTGPRPAPPVAAKAVQERAAVDRRFAHDLALLGSDHYLSCVCTT